MVCKKCENFIIEEMIRKHKENAIVKEYLKDETVPMYNDPIIEVPYLNNGEKYWLTERIKPKFCCNCGSKIKEE